MIKEILKSRRTQIFAGFVASLVIRFTAFTMRWENKIPDDTLQYAQENKPFIVCTWHNRLFPCAPWWQRQNFPLPHIMISSHRDGFIIASAMRFLNIPVIEGSTHKQAVRAAAKALRVLKEGGSVAITPDGPRGPRYEAQDGAAFLSEKAKVPIILLSYDATWVYVFKKSWDHFKVPLPFSRATMRMSKPLYGLTAKTLTEHLNQL